MKLMELTVNDFVNELGDSSPAPGGGSAAALAGVLGASLCVMVANLTIGKRKYQDAWVPMKTLEAAVRLVDLVKAVLQNGNPNCITDVGVATQFMRSAAMGAAYNVLINLPGIGDETLKRDLKKKANALLAEVVAITDDIENELRKRLP